MFRPMLISGILICNYNDYNALFQKIANGKMQHSTYLSISQVHVTSILAFTILEYSMLVT